MPAPLNHGVIGGCLPSATLPAVIDSEEEDDDEGTDSYAKSKKREVSLSASFSDRMISEGFLQPADENGEAVSKQLRAAKKKLQQVEALELKQFTGYRLDDQQLAKLRTKRELRESILSLEAGIIPVPLGKEIKTESASKMRGKEKVPSVDEVSKASASRHSRREKKKNKGQVSSDNRAQASTDDWRLRKLENNASKQRSVDTKETTVKRSASDVPSTPSPDPKHSNFRTLSGFTSVTPEGPEVNADRSGSSSARLLFRSLSTSQRTGHHLCPERWLHLEK